MALDNPATWKVTMHSATLNGITQRWADTASTAAERHLPVILFMHGWPESWFSWRHQLLAVKKAGYRGIAPDMRGYGGTDAPEDFAQYTCHILAKDMIALLGHLGATKACLVGHDHGANLGWSLSLLHPEVFVCYMALSVPFTPRAAFPPLEMIRKMYGDERKYPEENPRFFYMIHHLCPSAAEDYGKRTRAAFYVLYRDQGGPVDPPSVTSGSLFVDGKAEPMVVREPQPRTLPKWISQPEVDYFISEFERAGWTGGLNWYRVMDMNWHATPELAGATVKIPCAFVAGADDTTVTMFGGDHESVKEQLKENCPQMGSVTFVPGAGHWIQQERPDAVIAREHRTRFTTIASRL